MQKFVGLVAANDTLADLRGGDRRFVTRKLSEVFLQTPQLIVLSAVGVLVGKTRSGRAPVLAVLLGLFSSVNTGHDEAPLGSGMLPYVLITNSFLVMTFSVRKWRAAEVLILTQENLRHRYSKPRRAPARLTAH